MEPLLLSGGMSVKVTVVNHGPIRLEGEFSCMMRKVISMDWAAGPSFHCAAAAFRQTSLLRWLP